MRYRPNWLDFTYEAQFASPVLAFATAPAVVLESMYNTLAPRFPLTTSDLSVQDDSIVSNVKSKIILFGGNGTIELTADSLGARFNNPIGKGDDKIIQDCIQLIYDAIAKVKTGVKPKEEKIAVRMFAELLDEPADAMQFLRGLVPVAGMFADISESTALAPNIGLVLRDDEEKWDSEFTLARSVRAKNEFFMTSTTRFFLGSKYSSLAEKATKLTSLLNEMMRNRANLHRST